MGKTVLKVDNLSKIYRLGEVGTGTISHDLNRFWARVRGKEDPYATIGQVNDRASKAESDYVYALKDVDFEVKEGEVLGIIGKNGAGKSTLLKLISKITAPSTGSIKAKGRIASLLEVGTGMHPEMTARENIYLNGTILGMRKHEITRKFDEIIDFAGCQMYVDTPVKRFSSGMRVRLGFAVAAFLEPEILIVDEVLAVGDAEFQKKAIGKMKDVSSNDGRTVLFVSHNMASVKSLCTHGVVLNNGQIDFSGTADESVDYYLNKFKSNSQVPLKDRLDRAGNGKIRFTDAYFKDSAGHRTQDLISGTAVSMVLEYEKKSQVDLKDLFISTTILDENESQITLLATDELGYQFSPLQDSGKFIFSIDKLNLRAGTYYFTLFISERKSLASGHIQMDVVREAGSFEVLPGDYWNTGHINRKKGFILDAKMSQS